MDYCSCDYDPPAVFHDETRKARKEYRCGECGGKIQPGETYEHVWGVWGSHAETHRTCKNCFALREYVQAHVPCFCWVYGNMLEMAMESLADHNNECPGLWFGGARLYIRAAGARKAQAST